MEINRETAKQISAEAQEALQAVAERHGLEVTVGGGSFDAGSFRPKIEFKTAEADESEWARYAPLFDLPADAYGQEFTSSGRRFRITGIKPRSPKWPVVGVDVTTGQTFKFTVEGVQRALAPTP